MAREEFQHEYDLSQLQVITPNKRDFRMLVTPRYVTHYCNNVYEDFTSDLLLNLSRDNTLFIDIGASYGYYTILVGTKHPNSKIIAFEPVPETFEVLKRNIALNELENAECHNSAVSDSNGRRKFKITEASDSCGFHDHPLAETLKEIEVEAICLDDFLREAPRVPTIIKIDAEGHEPYVLQGMKRLLKDAEDLKIIIELNPACLRNAGYLPEKLLEELSRLGFDIYAIDDKKRMTYKVSPTSFERYFDYLPDESKTSYTNILCIKRRASLSVCFFSHSAQLYGAELSLLELVTEMVKDRGVICSVVLPNDGPLKQRLEDVGVSTHIVSYSWSWDSKVLPEERMNALCTNSSKSVLYSVKQLLSKINPDVIVTNTMVIPWGAIAASLLGKPHIWFIHEFGELDHGLKPFLPLNATLDFVKDLSDIILTNSDAVQKALFPGISSEKVLTVYQYINIPPTALQQEDGITFTRTNSTRLAISGSVQEGKGQRDAILAVKELVSRGRDVELVMMGGCTTDYAQDLKKTLRELQLEEHVRFVGFKENPYPIMNQADIVLVCSRNEAFGRVTVEGMLLKKPVIGTNTGGTPELIKDGVNGLLYEHGDYKQLAAKIEYLIDHPDEATRMGENGYQFARETFTKSEFGGKIYKLLLNLKRKADSEGLSSRLTLKGAAILDALLTASATRNQKIAALVTELGSSLFADDAQIAQLEASVQEKVAQIAQLETSVQEKAARINSLEFQIRQIHCSIPMQLVNRYQRIVEKLLRTGTKRRYYYELGLTGIRVILNEGWGSFWFKFRRWLKQRANLTKRASYKQWIAQNEPKPEELERQRQESLSFQYRPKISIITPVWNTDEKWLRLAIESALSQTYDNWELCLADGASTKPHVKKVLQEYADNDSRIKVKFLLENKGIAGNSNEALSLATGEFIGLLDHDDELAPFALYEVVRLLNEKPDADFIYSDEDKITTRGIRRDPFFKPDWSPDMFLSCMYTCHLGVYRKKIVDEIGGFRLGYDGSQDYDLVLRFIGKTDKIYHIPKVLYHWRALLESAASGIGAKPYACIAAKKAISDYVLRNNIEGQVNDGAWLGSYRVKREIIGNPLVSIIIPTRDSVGILKRCVDTILEKTDYTNYEILIVDNQSTESETFDYYNEIRRYPKIRIIQYDSPFKYSAMNNYAVSQANGEHILLLNNDTEVITGEWLRSMLEHSQRREVGAVGAKLLYPNNTIQHCGVIVGLGGVAGHAFRRCHDDAGYFGRTSIVNNYSAVTAACMMLRKEVFEEVGGFDEYLSVAYNDVDLCLKIRERGYLIVYTPYAQLYHHESYSRGYEDMPEKQARSLKEVEYVRARWGHVIDKGDPYYNPNLTLDAPDFSLSVRRAATRTEGPENTPRRFASPPEQLEQEFAKRGPWVTKFVIGGKPYGGQISFEDDVRITQFFDNFPDVHSILDLGSLEGGQTFALAKHAGVHILGIEGRQSNIERAKFVQRLLQIKNVDFVLADLETCDLSQFGQFDAVFCSGILYHLPEPWKLIEKIRAITNKLFLWTHYAAEDKPNQVLNGFRGSWHQEHGLEDSLSGLSPKSFWPTLQSLQDMLNHYGFTTLKILEDNPKHPDGACVTMVLWAEGEPSVCLPDRTGLKIDIGCGTHKKEGFIGVDFQELPEVDYVLDVTKERLPFEDNSVSHVFSSHLFEHIGNPQFVLREIARVCRDRAVVEIWLPYLKSNDAFVLGHQTFYQEATWRHICIFYDDLWQKDFRGRLVLQHFKYAVYPGIEDKLNASNIPLLFALEHLFNIAYEFCTYMIVVKNPQEAQAAKVTEPELYAGYSRNGPFRKIFPREFGGHHTYFSALATKGTPYLFLTEMGQ